MGIGWETVVVSLGGSLVTGTAAIAVAILNLRSSRLRELQTRQVEATAWFETKLLGARDAVRYSIDHPEDEGAKHNAGQLLGEVEPTLGPVSLLFSNHTKSLSEAKKALGCLRHSDVTGSDNHRTEFERQVLEIVRK